MADASLLAFERISATVHEVSGSEVKDIVEPSNLEYKGRRITEELNKEVLDFMGELTTSLSI